MLPLLWRSGRRFLPPWAATSSRRSRTPSPRRRPCGSRWCCALGTEADRLRGEGATVIFVGVDHRLAGLIAIADPVKHTAAAGLHPLRDEGIEVVMLTGDNRVNAE